MTLAPRVVVVHRTSEYDELLTRHGTRGQAAFFLSSRGRSLDELEARHRLDQHAVDTVTASIPVDWRRGKVERTDLDRFLFAPDDLVVAVGQDGLVANVAKYLDAQAVIGINPDPARNPGVLVPHTPEAAGHLLRDHGRTRDLTMVAAVTDDGQRLIALNEIFVGPPTHQTARYRIDSPAAPPERQASSGVIVATGTGATGWCRSIWLERRSDLALAAPTDRALTWFVREAWPSPTTGNAHTEGTLTDGELLLTAESDHLVVFGDGIESDCLPLSWGQTLRVRIADQTLRLVV